MRTTRGKLIATLTGIPLLVGGTGAVSAQQSTAAPAAPKAAVAKAASVPGIDVSHHQGKVNWAAHKRAGVKFAYIKATEGTTYRDPKFKTNYASARRVGIIRGAYHFARPDGASGKSQADTFIRHGGNWRADGYTLPGVVDLEGLAGKPACYRKSKAGMRSWIRSFVERYKQRTGRAPVIYTTTSWWKQCTGNSKSFGRSPLWIARYNGKSTPGELPKSWSKWTMWQYTDKPLDKNKFNGTLTGLKNFANRR